jgi:hypothetical protein
LTELVPAPDDPVIEMMGCFADIQGSGWNACRVVGGLSHAFCAKESRAS